MVSPHISNKDGDSCHVTVTSSLPYHADVTGPSDETPLLTACGWQVSFLEQKWLRPFFPLTGTTCLQLADGERQACTEGSMCGPGPTLNIGVTDRPSFMVTGHRQSEFFNKCWRATGGSVAGLMEVCQTYEALDVGGEAVIVLGTLVYIWCIWGRVRKVISSIITSMF